MSASPSRSPLQATAPPRAASPSGAQQPEPGQSWTRRELSPEEREWLRSQTVGPRIRDWRHIINAGAAGAALALFAAAGYVQVRSLPWTAAPLPFFLLLPVGLFAAWAYSPRRMARAWRGRQIRTPLWAWVVPVEITHWESEDGEGQVSHEVSCSIQCRTRSLAVTAEQLAWFPEGPAEVEMLPDRNRSLYRYHFETHTVEAHPQLRLLTEKGAPPAPAPPDVAEPAPAASPAPRLANLSATTSVLASAPEWEMPRRRKRHSSHKGKQVGTFRLRRRDIIWLVIATVVGVAITLMALYSGGGGSLGMIQ